jgi:DNA-binding transcriptional ArsR family regulator
MTSLDQTLAALAEPTRRAVIELLRQGPLRAGELAEALELSPPAMSRHLKVLRQAALIEDDRLDDDARVRVYRLRPERIGELATWIREVEGFWGAQLEAFKAHAERTRGRKG